MSRYWDNYWARQRKPNKCSVCHDTGIVSKALENADHSMEIMPCPMKCKAVSHSRMVKKPLLLNPSPR